MNSSIMVGPLLQTFFTEHLQAQQRLSQQTVASYQDTFRLLLRWIERETGVGPAALTMTHLDAPHILEFLATLETERKNAVVSRNLRLTAIRSFYRFAALRDPEIAGLATTVLAIPAKRTDSKVRDYITRNEFESILATFDQSQWLGRRNYALLLTMYNTGARVSEMASLRREQVHFAGKGQVELHGKGRKERCVPLWERTSKVLKAWFSEAAIADAAAFPTRRGGPLTRFAIHLLLRKAAAQAVKSCPRFQTKAVSPHQLRHGTAMAMLESGVDLAVIALWLGHESIETTNVYVHSSLAMKERALGKLAPAGEGFRRFKADDSLMTFLNAL
jgi:integrase/recombinase XerD